MYWDLLAVLILGFGLGYLFGNGEGFKEGVNYANNFHSEKRK